MITAPSMIIPKSMAPKLIKFASTSKMYIREIAKSKLNGMTEATTRPERTFPNSKTTTKITIRHPKIKFSVIVKVVRAINSERSKNPLIITPSGRVGSISASLSFTRSMVALDPAPLSIITCPRTFSPSPLAVIAPNRLA